ncbi:hypothetical protein PanWU01x14_265470 [Parasponia andersonii]|uniref:Uncharacterized protein n=1 Tax=Parasponia andersonii TaxID=3476 RepID=A0A2P5B780_PARAD|nr:hypothetical protein PanWU01x14_265470 [Parasponia andersonii]
MDMEHVLHLCEHLNWMKMTVWWFL